MDGTAAGPVGGDDLALDLHVGDGGQLDLTSVAASLVHPGPGGEPSSTRLRAHVGRGGSLRWRPRPSVLIGGCDHRTTTVLELAAGATVEWREEVVLGRHQSPSGSLLQRLVVDLDGAPLLRSDLAVQQLAGDAVLVTALAAKAGALTAALDELVASVAAPGGTAGPWCSSASSWP